MTPHSDSLGDLLELSSRLRHFGPRGLMWWQWMALPAAILIAWAVGQLLGRVTRGALFRVAARTAFTWDDQLVARLGSPLALTWALGILTFLASWLALPARAAATLERWVRGGFFFVFFWALARAVDIGHEVLLHSSWAEGRPSSRAVLPLARRVAKVVVFSLAIVSLLSELGYPVTSLVAGLGIGGLALALAAQKTVENLFGTVSLSADQPLREGDFVKVDETMGTVESIGLRSTRIRTLDRTVVTIPNGKLADLRIETFAPRDRIRLACMLNLAAGSTVTQVRQVLQEAERLLRAHPRLWPDGVTVRLKELAGASINIEIAAFFKTTDFGEFQAFRQEILLGFMEIVEAAGTTLAVPVRAIRLSPPGPSPT